MNPFLIDEPASIGLSGGRTSGFMLYKILEASGGKLNPDVFVSFRNTGKERPETLDFVHEIETQWNVPVVWLEFDTPYQHPVGRPTYKIVDYFTAARNSEPFDAFLNYYDNQRYFEYMNPPALPSLLRRMCTSSMKIKTNRWYMLDQGYSEWLSVIGIRKDEPRRLAKYGEWNGKSAYKEHETCYVPLAIEGVVKADVLDFWNNQPFDLQLLDGQSNCDLCFLKSTSTLLESIRKDPKSADWWIEKERNAKRTFRMDRVGYAELKTMALAGATCDVQNGIEDCHCTET